MIEEASDDASNEDEVKVKDEVISSRRGNEEAAEIEMPAKDNYSSSDDDSFAGSRSMMRKSFSQKLPLPPITRPDDLEKGTGSQLTLAKQAGKSISAGGEVNI